MKRKMKKYMKKIIKKEKIINRKIKNKTVLKNKQNPINSLIINQIILTLVWVKI
jgi:hypothetical protein